MIFSLAVYSPPSSQASYSAWKFARAALKKNHSIYRIFFYHDGAYNGSGLRCMPQDEFDIGKAWSELQKQHELDLVVCIAAGLKRGVINQDEQSRYDKESFNINPYMELSGLGQLVDATVKSDKLISFGG